MRLGKNKNLLGWHASVPCAHLDFCLYGFGGI